MARSTRRRPDLQANAYAGAGLVVLVDVRDSALAVDRIFCCDL
jgi:hypothetical protein